MNDLSHKAGVRISPPQPQDDGRTMFEMFVKESGEVVMRGPSREEFVFIIRGKDRRRHPRAVAAERRTLEHGTGYYAVEDDCLVWSTK